LAGQSLFGTDCEEIEDWQTNSIDVKVAVNSGRSTDRGFVALGQNVRP